MSSFFEEVTGYRLKVERDGKEIINVPGILALPGALIAPKVSIVGTVAASLLGCSIHLENEEGKTVDVSKEVKKAAETVADAAKETAKSIREEVDKVWNALSADDPEECPAGEENAEENVDGNTEENAEINTEDNESADIPTIHVVQDDSKEE